MEWNGSSTSYTMYVVSGRVYYVTFDSNLGDVNALISVTNLLAGDCVQIIDNYFREYVSIIIIYYFLIFIITFYIYTITFTILSRF